MTALRLARYEQAQEGKAPEEMEMETLSLPGRAAPTLAGTQTPPYWTEPRRAAPTLACTVEIRALLRGPAGSAPRLACTIAKRKEAGTETLALQGTKWELQLRLACTLEIRDLL